MSSASLREFDRQVSGGIAADLAGRGFIAGSRRIFRRTIYHEGTETTQIVEFQVGRRSLAGRFTVNLAVYNAHHLPTDWLRADQSPEPADCTHEFLTQRLGFLRQPRRSLFDRLRRSGKEPYDHWWAYDADQRVMQAELSDVATTLSTRGFAWLDSRTSVRVLDWARRQIDLRKAWIASTASLGTTTSFTPEPLPTIE